MRHKKDESRKQRILFQDTIDDYIDDDNPVRFLDAFVNSLDMKKVEFNHANPKETGRPPYDPKDLLKLYIYGYLNKVRSNRRLKKKTYRNLEMMWLTRGLKPVFKIIADFRKNDWTLRKKIFHEFRLLCRKMKFFGNKFLAKDGNKFKVSNNMGKNYTEGLHNTKMKNPAASSGVYMLTS